MIKLLKHDPLVTMIWTVVVGILAAICYYNFRPMPAVLYHPIRFNEKSMTAIVDYVSRQPHSSDTHDIALPPSLAKYSITGRAYFDDGYVFIPSWVGRTIDEFSLRNPDENVMGYLYGRTPWSSRTNTISMYIPPFCHPSQARNDSGSYEYQTLLQRKITSHWYYVETSD